MTAQQDTSLGYLVDGQSRRRGFGVLLGRLVRLPGLGGWLARASRSPILLRPASTRVTRLHAWLLRRSWLFAAGQPVLSLTSTGRKTGLARTTAVACFSDGRDLVLAGMNLGVSRHPSWALNLEASGEAEISLGGETIPVLARRAEGAEAERLWRRWLELQPSAAAYRELAGREIPLFISSRAARRRSNPSRPDRPDARRG